MKSPTQLEQRTGEPRAGPDDHGAAPAGGPPLISLDDALFKDVSVSLKVRLGEVAMTVHDLLELRPGSVVKLDSQLNDYVELKLNDTVVAIGEIVAVGDNFGVRIVDISPKS